MRVTYDLGLDTRTFHENEYLVAFGHARSGEFDRNVRLQ